MTSLLTWLLLIANPVPPAEPPCLWLRGLTGAGGGAIVTVAVDLDAVAQCFPAPAPAVDPAKLTAGVRTGAGCSFRFYV